MPVASFLAVPLRLFSLLTPTWFEFVDLAPCGMRPEFVSVITGDGRQILVRRLMFAGNHFERLVQVNLDALMLSTAVCSDAHTAVPATLGKAKEAFPAVNSVVDALFLLFSSL